MSDVLINSADKHAMDESGSSPAHQNVVAGKVDLVLQPFDETEPLLRALPQPSTPRVNALPLAQTSFPQIEFQPEETAPTANIGTSLMSRSDQLQWIQLKEVPLPFLRVHQPQRLRFHCQRPHIRRIGWASGGNPTQFNDHNRSLSPECLRGVRLPTLVLTLRVQPDTPFTDDVPFDLLPPAIELTDFSDTARWLETLDLVITVDTPVAHLAGGLGLPVWILVPYAPDWRWSTDGDTTRWYGSARLLGQPKPNDWQSVLQSVQQALETGAA